MRRKRGPGGRFLTKEEVAVMRKEEADRVAALGGAPDTWVRIVPPLFLRSKLGDELIVTVLIWLGSWGGRGGRSIWKW
jgi:hypothetical protein